MKKSTAIGIAISVALVAAYVFTRTQDKTQTKAAEAEKTAADNAVRAAVANLASRHGAITNWDVTLSRGEKYRTAPILSVELEKLWSTGVPILFIGDLIDVSSSNDSSYKLTLEQSLLANIDHMFSTNLKLELEGERKLVDDFLSKHQELFQGYDLEHAIAVIANIDSIDSDEVITASGSEEDVKIGKGKLIDLVFVGLVEF